jgi:pilus assembly protein Flp/PilA
MKGHTHMNELVLKPIVALQTRLGSTSKGATAVEYGLLVALIAAVIITAVTLFGTDLAALFNMVAGKISAATSAAGV